MPLAQGSTTTKPKTLTCDFWSIQAQLARIEGNWSKDSIYRRKSVRISPCMRRICWVFGRFYAEMGSATRRGRRRHLVSVAWVRWRGVAATNREEKTDVELKAANGGGSRRTGREKGVLCVKEEEEAGTRGRLGSRPATGSDVRGGKRRRRWSSGKQSREMGRRRRRKKRERGSRFHAWTPPFSFFCVVKR